MVIYSNFVSLIRLAIPLPLGGFLVILVKCFDACERLDTGVFYTGLFVGGLHSCFVSQGGIPGVIQLYMCIISVYIYIYTYI